MIPDLEKYFKGELNESESLKAQLFIAEHPDDPRVLALAEAAFDSEGADDSFVEQDLASLHETLGVSYGKVERRMRLWRSLTLAAAAVAVPLALATGILASRNRPVEYRQITVPDCGMQTLTLSDGTVLSLGSGSSVIYPEHFQGKERSVFLSGQVFAQVSKDPRHPFVIHSGDVDVRVYGTTFNFKSWTDADQVELCLLEGAVTMSLGEVDREVVVTPGDMVRYSRRDGNYELGSFDRDDYGPDAVNYLRFNNETLAEIACELEKVFGVRIVILDGKLASRRFFSYFTNGESLDEILEALSSGSMKIGRQGSELITLSTK